MSVTVIPAGWSRCSVRELVVSTQMADLNRHLHSCGLLPNSTRCTAVALLRLRPIFIILLKRSAISVDGARPAALLTDLIILVTMALNTSLTSDNDVLPVNGHCGWLFSPVSWFCRLSRGWERLTCLLALQVMIRYASWYFVLNRSCKDIGQKFFFPRNRKMFSAILC